jgi:hypothetical protein
MARSVSVLALVVFFGVADPAAGQWSADPAVNLALGDRTGAQVQPKVVVLEDGGAYVSWFDNATGGYDVVLQRIDAAGDELWPHDGVLLADRGFSSTQDYDLAVDTAGNALLAFRDDRTGSVLITATRVSPAGVQLWGSTGVQLTTGTDFVAAPKVAGTTDGEVVVAWTNNGDVKLQKLDTSGVPQWGSGVTILAIGGDSTSASDLDASDAGGVIVSMVRGFLSPNHLHAQKLDASGNALWGATPLAVYDGGALQIANFPQFVSDGTGGAVFSWYSVSPLQCHAQRVLANGTEAFGHDGVVVSTVARERTLPAVTFDPSTADTYVFWREEVGGPTPTFGVYGQKLDAGGIRQWGAGGVVVAALSPTEITQVRQVDATGGRIVAWVETLAFGNQRLRVARVAADGSLPWDPDTVLASSVASGKSRLAAAASGSDGAILVWSDARADEGDVFAQNVNADGTLGPFLSCEQGTVNSGAGPVADVLFVNGSTGTVVLGTGQSITVALDAAPLGPDPARYFLYAWPGLTVNETPFEGGGATLGCTVNPTPLDAGLVPQPFRCVRGAGVPSLVCGGVRQIAGPATAPLSITKGGGLMSPVVVRLQGVLEDDGAGNVTGFSVTNAVVVQVVP